MSGAVRDDGTPLIFISSGSGHAISVHFNKAILPQLSSTIDFIPAAMFVISPMSNCGSIEKRETFLNYLSKIAPVTLQNEHQCLAYAWFRNAEDNSNVPHEWVRGFEVYETIEANTVTHRASAEYKAFRAAVQDEALLDRPSDLGFWRPTGVGFLAKQTVDFMQRHSRDHETKQYIITREIVAADACQEKLVSVLQGVAALAEKNEKVQSFWVLDRGHEQYDGSLYILERYSSKDASTEFAAELEQQLTPGYEDLCQHYKHTTWVESGIGFLCR